jgi:hypothetical protein
MAAGLILVGIAGFRDAPAPVQVGLWLSLVLVGSTAFFWPRCPHCRARVVRFNAREWVPGPACHSCGKPYDESITPAHLLTFMKAVDDAEKLRKTDPARADLLLQQANANADAASLEEREDLRARMHTDNRAALILRKRLESDLKGFARLRKELEKRRGAEPAATVGLTNLTHLNQAALQELAEVEAAIERLRPPSR